MRIRKALFCAVFGGAFIYFSAVNLYEDHGQPTTPRTVTCEELAEIPDRYVTMTEFEIVDTYYSKGRSAWLVAYPRKTNSGEGIVIKTSSRTGEIALLRSAPSITGMILAHLSSDDEEALKKLQQDRTRVLKEGGRPGTVAGNLLFLVLGVGLIALAIAQITKAAE